MHRLLERRDVLAGLAGLAAAGPLSTGAAAAIRRTPALHPLVDHHVHLGSPKLSDYIEDLDKQDPSIFQLLSRDVFSRPTAKTVLHLLDEAGVRRAVLLSSAYLFMTATPPDSREAAHNMRTENEFTVATSLASNGRLLAFVAVNPFAPNADEELAHWRGRPGVHGIKLHLGAAGFHASAPEQVAILGAFFAKARQARLPLVVHLRGGGPYPKSEIETFIAKVVMQAGDLPVQIAHGGGYGGADQPTIDALSAFGEAIARRAPGTRNLFFDISGVALPETTAKALGSSDSQLAEFVRIMRRIGLDRFVIGSDWPALGRIAPYYALMQRELPLRRDEWARLSRNLAPYLRRR